MNTDFYNSNFLHSKSTIRKTHLIKTSSLLKNPKDFKKEITNEIIDSDFDLEENFNIFFNKKYKIAYNIQEFSIFLFFPFLKIENQKFEKIFPKRKISILKNSPLFFKNFDNFFIIYFSEKFFFLNSIFSENKICEEFEFSKNEGNIEKVSLLEICDKKIKFLILDNLSNIFLVKINFEKKIKIDIKKKYNICLENSTFLSRIFSSEKKNYKISNDLIIIKKKKKKK